jgi:exopolysaccharide biosynthesis polyprenyl glycosylphosphotransferase
VFGGAVTGVLLNEWNNCWEVPSALPIAVVAALLVGGAVAAGRVGVDWMVQRTRRLWDTPRRTLVVGMPEAVRDVLNVPALAIQRAFSVVGGIDAVGALADPRADGMLGGIHDMHRVIDRHEVETVIIAGAMPAGEFRHVVQLAERAGCSVFALPGTASLDGFSPELEWHGGDAFIRLSRPGMQGRHLLLKRLVDVVGGTLGLVLLSPLLLVVALAVRCSSPGPVLFRQLRVGRGGRLFRIYKFRSMVADAEARKAALARESLYASGHLFKMPNDPRVTRVGAFLRKTSIDELPQLWNVVAGHMSLVGPRPPLPSEVAEYDDHHFVRFCMRPGLTGPWQVSGRNGVTDFERVVQLEHEYMRAWSIRKDLLILLRTIPAVLQQRGAH